jgi:hypothetical protein
MLCPQMGRFPLALLLANTQSLSERSANRIVEYEHTIERRKLRSQSMRNRSSKFFGQFGAVEERSASQIHYGPSGKLAEASSAELSVVQRCIHSRFPSLFLPRFAYKLVVPHLTQPDIGIRPQFYIEKVVAGQALIRNSFRDRMHPWIRSSSECENAITRDSPDTFFCH